MRSFDRIASALAERAAVGGAQEEAATYMRTRSTVATLPYLAPGTETQGHQLNAFRGTIYSAVDKIARRTAQIAMRLHQVEVGKGGEEEKTEVFLHPFLGLITEGAGRRPHEEFSVWELKYWTQTSLDLTGEAWWLVERSKLGTPKRITPLPANRMTVVYNQDTGFVSGYMFTPNGAALYGPDSLFIPKYSNEEMQARKNLTVPFMTFFRYPSPKGIEDPRGWSPVKASAYAYDINLAEYVYKRNFLNNGAQLGGILQSEINLTTAQINEYLDQFERRHRGADRAGRPIVLPKMLKWSQTEPTPRDLQFIETVGLTDKAILQTYGISDAKLGRADVGNRATADAMDVTFNREVIQSRLDTQLSKINSDFLPIYPGQDEMLYFVAEYDDPVPADMDAARLQEAQDILTNLRTRNEIRKERGLDEYGAYGDRAWMPLSQTSEDPWKEEWEEPVPVVPPPADPNAPPPVDDPNAPPPVDDPNAEADPASADEAAAKKGRAVTRQGPGDAMDEIWEYLNSAETTREFLANLRASVEEILSDEVTFASDLVGADAEINADEIATRWLDVLENRIKGIDQTTATSIRDILIDGLTNGESVMEMAGRITDAFDFADSVRSMYIARTEVLGAQNFAAHETYTQAGAANKRWLSTPDERTRDTHKTANGQVVAMSALFAVGGSALMFPGDPNGSAAEVINCRCTLVPEIKGRAWDDSRLRAVWDSYDTRATKWEQKIRGLVRQEFRKQHSKVLAILGTGA